MELKQVAHFCSIADQSPESSERRSSRSAGADTGELPAAAAPLVRALTDCPAHIVFAPTARTFRRRSGSLLGFPLAVCGDPERESLALVSASVLVAQVAVEDYAMSEAEEAVEDDETRSIRDPPAASSDTDDCEDGMPLVRQMEHDIEVAQGDFDGAALQDPAGNAATSQLGEEDGESEIGRVVSDDEVLATPPRHPLMSTPLSATLEAPVTSGEDGRQVTTGGPVSVAGSRSGSAMLLRPKSKAKGDGRLAFKPSCRPNPHRWCISVFVPFVEPARLHLVALTTDHVFGSQLTAT